ncbi:hypothetical protein K493DRAFT_262785 [Basidiobolus meristosporus CBS 931.73]|uniref:Myb-like, SWIRM and MPN domain-containing protein 1 n=1 Tax=Basidiobolus meristosporus CBS 931.73 TaxID=1314790 RepID=A0A1Y1Y506_9FUNG|nr:hypothetical protein K493DRAFT_262785 [Basidiobolus meristosporus CBS 931.73]|eukprot:ORX93100.1 hypothetical protein K493DRAFT_262785 [Basidiobolus meristosporus CBS 931.73]
MAPAAKSSPTAKADGPPPKKSRRQSNTKPKNPKSAADKVLTKQEEEAMSDAYIAKLMQQENACLMNYYDEYSNQAYFNEPAAADDSFEDDDDYYTPNRENKTRKRAAPRSQKKKEKTEDDTSKSDTSKDDINGEAKEESAPPPKSKKKTEKLPDGFNTGPYTDEEEKLFLSGLELHGREWKKLVEHMGTRNAESIRSHAQKHFIKLYRDGLALPLKVQESGNGYTLSGKELDPNSAAARPYLSRLPDNAAVKANQTPNPEKSEADGVPGSNESPIKSPEKKKPRIEKKSIVKKPREPPKDLDNIPLEEREAYTNSGRTNYSKHKLRRTRPSLNFSQITGDADPLTMLKCEHFCGQPGSGTRGAQPFSINVDSNVLVGMDFHAHLMTTEIIGFLAGQWDREKKLLAVNAVFPCRSLQTGQNHVNVEMDPTSECEVRQAIKDRDMQVVGWYHSHPTFAPDPSLVDMENQRNYQHLFRHEGSDDEPFVGAIVGPYDPRLPGYSSVINWFYSSTYADERGHPKRLIFDLVENSELPSAQADEWLKLTNEYQESPEKVCLSDSWRPGHPETKLDKMLGSLAGRMPWLRIESGTDSATETSAENPVDPAGNLPDQSNGTASESLIANEDTAPAAETDGVSPPDDNQEQSEPAAEIPENSPLEAQYPAIDLEKQQNDYFLGKIKDLLQAW